MIDRLSYGQEANTRFRARSYLSLGGLRVLTTRRQHTTLRLSTEACAQFSPY